MHIRRNQSDTTSKYIKCILKRSTRYNNYILCMFQNIPSYTTSIVYADSKFHRMQQVYEIHIYLELILFAVSWPQPRASVSQLPAALWRPQKEHTPVFLSMYLVDLVFADRFFGPQVVLAQNDADEGDDDHEPTTGMPTATSKQARPGTKYPIQGIPPSL